MAQAKPREVMQDYEYERARQELENFYGSPDGDASVLAAKRDQAFAKLFYDSGWTREKLAEREARSLGWVNFKLRLARFIEYATNNTTVLFETLTERAFRSYWEQTNKGNEDDARFAEVIRLMQEPAAAKPKPGPRPAPEPETKTEAPASEPEPQSEPEPVEEPKARAPKPSPKLEKAQAFIRDRMDKGLPFSRSDCKNLGVSHAVFAQAQAIEETINQERKSDTIPPEPNLSPAHKERWEAVESRLRAKMEAELAKRQKRLDDIFDLAVEDRIKARIDEVVLPYYKERFEQADLLTKHGKPFTKQEFTGILLWALHSDTSSPENRTRAFILLKERELLLRPEEREKPISGGLVYTMAELMEMRKKVMEQNRARAKAAREAKTKKAAASKENEEGAS